MCPYILFHVLCKLSDCESLSGLDGQTLGSPLLRSVPNALLNGPWRMHIEIETRIRLKSDFRTALVFVRGMRTFPWR